MGGGRAVRCGRSVGPDSRGSAQPSTASIIYGYGGYGGGARRCASVSLYSVRVKRCKVHGATAYTASCSQLASTFNSDGPAMPAMSATARVCACGSLGHSRIALGAAFHHLLDPSWILGDCTCCALGLFHDSSRLPTRVVIHRPRPPRASVSTSLCSGFRLDAFNWFIAYNCVAIYLFPRHPLAAGPLVAGRFASSP